MKKILLIGFSLFTLNSFAQKLSELPVTTTIGGSDWLIALKVGASTANRITTNNLSKQEVPYAGALLTGVSFPVAASYSMATGDNDFYTVPLGKRALIQVRIQAYNASGLTVSLTYPEVKIGGTYYKLGSGFSVAANTASSPSSFLSGPIVLEGGDILAANTNGNGVSLWYNVMVFDSSSNLKSSRILSLANGNNTLFTVPAGKTFYNANFAGTTAGSTFTAGFYNASGISVNSNLYAIPSGQSVSDIYRIAAASSISNNGAYMTTFPNMSAGGFCVINVDSGLMGQFAWATYVVQ